MVFLKGGVVIAIALFFIMVFIVGALWMVFNNFAWEPYNQIMDNQTAVDPNPYPALRNLYTYGWIALPIALIVAYALKLAYDERGGFIG